VTGLIGKKIGMTQVFSGDGNLVPVTIIDASSCIVVGTRTPQRDQYSALMLGFGEGKEKAFTKAALGAFKKAGAPIRRHIKEFRVNAVDVEKVKVGDPVSVDLFTKGQLVDVVGTTKGRGFQGVVKRWSFSGFRQTHGTHEYRRHPGAIGQRKTPGRVYPNKKMPGHYGVERVTMQNLQVVDVDKEKNLLLVRGAIPGHPDSIVYVSAAIKGQKKAASTAS
jgi:large subunit ribosomal protein L3